MLKAYCLFMLLALSCGDEVDQRFRKLEHIVELQAKQIEDQAKKIEDQAKQIQNLQQIKHNDVKDAFDTTIEELEARVELLEEDMFQTQGDVNTLQYTVQETVETVMDQTANIDEIEANLSNLGNATVSLTYRISQIEQFNFETKNSAFYADLTTDLNFGSSLQTITFDSALINNGGHYNPSTGQYTAPVNGIYYFSAYIRATPSANFRFYLDGQFYMGALENYSTETNNEASEASILVRLQAGQVMEVLSDVDIMLIKGFTGFRATYFGGYLVFPDSM